MIKVGTIGSGFIVDNFFEAVSMVEGIEVKAVYSRTPERAREFADKHGVEKAYSDMEAFLSDEELNFIYVASPNSLHYPQSYEALMHGKNVICEKPFVPTYEEAKTLQKLAIEKGLYLFEAITTIHYPNYRAIRERLPQLGKLTVVQANYSQYSSRMDRLISGIVTNAFDPHFAGGALADINIYNLHFVCGLFGFPEEVHYYPNMWENGIDVSGVLILKYPDLIAECVGAKDSASRLSAQIQGQMGYITVNSQSSVCSDFDMVIPKENREEHVNLQEDHHGLYYELLDFVKVFEEKDYAQCLEWLEYSTRVVDVYERARKSAGIQFTN